MKKFKFLASKNIRMFLWAAVIIAALMTVFFVFITTPLTPKSYIAFSFIWLSAIISVCMVYLVPRDSVKIRNFMSMGITAYLGVNFAFNIVFPQYVSLIFLVVVDFFLIFVILIFGIMLYYFGKQKEV